MSSTEQSTTNADTHEGGHLLYPQPGDGNLIPLVIQSFQQPSLLPENVPWTRLGEPLSKVGTLEAIWYWVLSPILVKGSERVDYSPRSCFFLILRFLAAAPLCALMIPSALASIVARIRNIKSKSPEQIEAQCQYPKLPTPLPHSLSSSSPSLLSSEAREAPPLSSDPSLTNIQLGGQLAPPRPDQEIVSNVSLSSSQFQSRGLSLGPRYLCFITDPEKRQYSTMKVSDYSQKHGDQADTEFVFVSYTRLQFRVVTDAEIDEWKKYPNEETREANRTLAHRDRETLIQWGIDAALAAGKRAFWLDFECVRDSDGVAKASSKSEDVYRICDIVRAAHSMIIAIGPPADEKVASILNGDENALSGSVEHATKWLREWGSRLWTLPELLLCPSEYRIKLYVAGDMNEPKSLAKRNFAERAWDDAESVKELVNHYEGSAILPPTQLISIALECFARRKTDQFSQGDIAYAVMGLFPDSQRPGVNQNDSGFRAFARLALAVEGSSLLSRLLCVAPAQPGAQWSDATDYWGVKLKDFRPCCDTVDVAGSNAVEVQNIHATPICWDKTERATLQERLPVFPEILFVILLFFPLFTWYRIIYLLVSAFGNNQTLRSGVSVFLFTIFFAQAILTPVTLPAFFLYEWKTRRKELRSARLVGMEGVLDCATAERHIYGYPRGRLTEIPSTTTSDSETVIYESGSTKSPRKFTFTLIDTCAQTLRVINCAAPPIAMMLCGEDAAGHRAILCSYNHETGVYHREGTLRVEECVRQQMKLARSVNLSLQSFPLKLTEAPHNEDAINSSMDGQASTKSREWKPELVFYIMQCIAGPQYGIIQLSGVAHGTPVALFFFGFIFAQPIVFFLLYKRLLSRAVAPMVYLQAALECLYGAEATHYETIFIIIFQGIGVGIFLPYMILHTISWHSIRETVFRLLFCTSAIMMSRDRQTAKPWLVFIFALFSTTLLDLPEVKPWNNSFEGVSLARRSARHKFSAEGRDYAPRWSRQDLPQSATIISLLLFIIATVSNSIVSGALLNTYHLFLYDLNYSLNSFYGLLTFFITIILWLYPHFIQIVTLGCSTISILGLYGCSMLDGKSFLWPAMASAQLLVLPLLWIWIVHHATSWKGFTTYLTLSLAGWGGWKLTKEIIGELDKRQVMVLAVIQPCLLGCVWVMEVIRERRLARGAQRRLVRSEYQDNAAEAAWEINEGVVHADASQGFKELKAKKWSIICWFGLLLVPQVLLALFTPTH